VRQKKSIFFTHNTHCINDLQVKVKGEGKNFELAECAMRRGVSVARTLVRMRKQWMSRWAKERPSFPKKRGGRREKKGCFERKSTSFYPISPHPQKTKLFSRKIFDSSKLNPYFCD